MLHAQLQTINTAQIDHTDVLYQIFPRQADGKLVQSVRQLGLCQPLVVQQKSATEFRLVCGFMRMQALQKLRMTDVAAYVLPIDFPQVEAFKLAVQENLSIRQFSAIEISLILRKLAEQFQITQDDMIKTWLPLLGFGRNPKILQLYHPLAGLPEKWQQAVTDTTIGIDFAADVAHLQADDSDAFYELLQKLRLGKNRQKEFLQLLQDVARLQNTTLHELLQQSAYTEIVYDEKLTPSQKAERLKAQLWESRYPNYSRVKAEYDALLKAAKLPPEVQVIAPPYFEGENFTASFVFKSEQEFGERLLLLQQLLQNGIAQKMIDLT